IRAYPAVSSTVVGIESSNGLTVSRAGLTLFKDKGFNFTTQGTRLLRYEPGFEGSSVVQVLTGLLSDIGTRTFVFRDRELVFTSIHRLELNFGIFCVVKHVQLSDRRNRKRITIREFRTEPFDVALSVLNVVGKNLFEL